MNQVVYNTSRGRFLEMTNPTFLENMSRLAIHFDPILALFAPLYLIYPSYRWLVLSQVVIVAFGAYFLFLIGKRILKSEKISLLISFSYLSFFGVQRMILFDFHAVVLATTFFIASFYFLEVKRWFWFYLFVFLALLTKEHVGLVVFFLGGYLLIGKKEIGHGLTTMVLGAVFFFFTVYVIIPYFRGDIHFAKIYFYGIESRIFSIINEGMRYFARLTTPLFFVFLAPEVFIIAAPEWGINILSTNSNMRAIYFHYQAIIVSFLFISLIYGIKRFLVLVKSQAKRVIVFFVFLCLNLYWIYLYNPLTFFSREKVNYFKINSRTKKSIDYWKEKLKDENIVVSTTPALSPFFTNRKVYFNFLFDPAFEQTGEVEDDLIKRSDNNYRLADYVIIYRREIDFFGPTGLPAKFYQKLKNDPDFQMIYDNQLNDQNFYGKIEVFKKINNYNERK